LRELHERGSLVAVRKLPVQHCPPLYCRSRSIGAQQPRNGHPMAVPQLSMPSWSLS